MDARHQSAGAGAVRRSLRLGKPLPEPVPCGAAQAELRLGGLPEIPAGSVPAAETGGGAFGIWEGRDITLARIREKAWKR